MNEQRSHCPNCGRELAPGAAFCSACGHRLGQPQDQPQQAAPTTPQAQSAAAGSTNPAIWIGLGIFALLVIVIVAAALGWWLLSTRSRHATVPTTAQTTAQAPATEEPTASVETAETTAPTTTEEATTPAATVTTAPAPPAQVTVPNVIGLSSGDAEERLNSIGGFQIIYNPSRYSDQYAKGAIISQHPRGGMLAQAGDVVYIVESLGPAPAPPPRRVAPPRPRRTVSGGQGEIAPYTRTRRVTDSDLRGYSNWQCTLIRNEIYARHGRPFNNSHIRRWFNAQSWYQPSSNFSESWLSPLERRNAEFIANYQKRTYGTPATRP